MSGAPPLFAVGRIVATPGVLAATNHAVLLNYLQRHLRGDWGELDPEDRAQNDAAVTAGERILSAYTLPDGTRLWIITEWDRSVTTFLLPEEY